MKYLLFEIVINKYSNTEYVCLGDYLTDLEYKKETL